MASIQTRWNITDEQKRILQKKLVSELKLLRAKANITQDDIAGVIGISRQSYCQIENGNKEMPWNIYLSLIFFFSVIKDTSKLLHTLGVYPDDFIKQVNGNAYQSINFAEVQE